MKIVVAMVMCAGVLAAQRPASMNVGPVNHGFGSVVSPSGVRGIGSINPIYSNPVPFPRQLGNTVAGHPIYPPPIPGHRPPHYRPPVAAVGVPVPVFVGGYSGYGYGYGYGYAPPESTNITVINSPPPSPSVIINQNYTPERHTPAMRDYTNENLPPPGDATVHTYQAPIPSNPEGQSIRAKAEDKPTIYLIALKSGAVYSTFAYWLEGDTLHYITTKHDHNRVSLDLVDRELCEQLNSERKVDFKLR